MLHYLFRFFRIALMVTPVYLLLRRPWRHSGKREIVLALWTIFQAALLVLALEGNWSTPAAMLRSALTRLKTGDSINLVPFRTISRFFRYTSREDFLVNILGNILLFLPWGFGLPFLWRSCRKPVRLLPLCLLPTLFIEFTQLFIGRHVDVDDLLLNFTGALLGAGCWFLLRRRIPVPKQTG